MITGTKITTIGGKQYRLKYTWNVLAEINEKYGDSPDLFRPDVVAFVGSAGMRKYHPEMTPEKIMELSPPLITFANDVQQALTWAYFGDKAIPEENIKKKQTLIGWIKHIGRRLLQVFHRSNSGN